MMTQMKERAVELIERIPDEKMFYVINILQNLEEMSVSYTHLTLPTNREV